MLRSVVAASLGPVILSALGCSGEDGGEGLEPTYDNVVMVLDTSCTFGTRCHGGAGRGQADLNFEQALADGTVVEALTLPSCEYDLLPRVAPGDPDGSWLMQKLDGETDAEGNLAFTPAPDWAPDPDGPHPERICPHMEGGEIRFGTLMPSVAPFEGLPRDRIEMFREWIRRGAPGPAGM